MHPSTANVTRFGGLALAVLIASACAAPFPGAPSTPAVAPAGVAPAQPPASGSTATEAAPAEAATAEPAPVVTARTDVVPAEATPTENPPSPAAPPQTLTPIPEFTLVSTDTIVLEETLAVIDESNPLVVAAAKDLARRLGVGLEAITLVSYEEVVWPDGSMGCPQPGMVYPQVQVDGAIIRLDAGGVAYTYHSGGSRPPFLCEKR